MEGDIMGYCSSYITLISASAPPQNVILLLIVKEFHLVIPSTTALPEAMGSIHGLI